MWVIQEALFAKSLRFYCGQKSTDREAFSRLHEIERQFDHGKGHGERLAPMQMTLAAPFGVILDDWDDYRKALMNGGVRLRWLLSVTEDAQCTEPLDNIFALLSMCSPLDRSVLQIDYRVSLRWALIHLCKYELIAREAYSPLWVLQTSRPNKNLMLPSWCPDYSRYDDDSRLSFPASAGRTNFRAAGQNTDWVALECLPLKPEMVPHFNSTPIIFEDEGSFETLVLTGIILDIVHAAFPAPGVDLYVGFDLAEDLERKAQRQAQLVAAAWEWEEYIHALPPEQHPYATTCGMDEAFWRTLICDRDFDWMGPEVLVERDLRGRFEAWMRRHPDPGRNGDEEYIWPFNQAVVQRLMRRSFVVTEKGYVGLGSDGPRRGDVVCLLRGWDVPFVLRERGDGFWEMVGEGYVHGVMAAEGLKGRGRGDFREFRVR
jgi:hypothetical protein